MSTMYYAQAQTAGQTAQHVLCANPPPSVTQSIKDLFGQQRAKSNLVGEVLKADEIPAHLLKPLEEFAALVAKTETCKIFELRKCSSCFVDGAPGNLILTSIGTQCWQCES
jgi:hypothetical protein